jgi:threonine aldolase
MRQSGVLAAAGLIAFDEGLARLADDHALARSLAETLGGLDGLAVRAEDVQTNIVSVRVARAGVHAGSLAEALEREGVRVLALAPDALRFVTHRDVGPADVERARAALARAL